MIDFLGIPRTAVEVFNMLPEGTYCEVIDNTLYMLPTPTTTHQISLMNILSKIHKEVTANDLGTALTRCDLYLDGGETIVVPDIFFVKKDREHIIQTKGIIGAPDFVIEVLSSNKIHDQQRKFDLYQQSRIPEYIIIDPEIKNIGAMF